MNSKLKIHRWIGRVAATFALLLSAPYGGWWIAGPVFPASTLLSLRGKTREEVRQILGEPSRILEDGDWHYSRPLNPGWIEVSFDSDGRICGVNDEQVDPVTFGSGSWDNYNAVNTSAETSDGPSHSN
jgi:hypothetical protein